MEARKYSNLELKEFEAVISAALEKVKCELTDLRVRREELGEIKCTDELESSHQSYLKDQLIDLEARQFIFKKHLE